MVLPQRQLGGAPSRGAAPSHQKEPKEVASSVRCSSRVCPWRRSRRGPGQLDVSLDGGRFITHGAVQSQFQLVSDILITREHRLYNVLSSPSVWSVSCDVM